MLGQRPACEVAQASQVGRLRTWCSAQGDQVPALGGIGGDHGLDLPDRGVPGEHGLQLAELDPQPADLDLVVGPPEQLERAVGAAGNQVAGQVRPGPRRAVRVGDEARRGQGRLVKVAAGQAGSADRQLPVLGDRDPLAVQRPADRDVPRCSRGTGYAVE